MSVQPPTGPEGPYQNRPNPMGTVERDKQEQQQGRGAQHGPPPFKPFIVHLVQQWIHTLLLFAKRTVTSYAEKELFNDLRLLRSQLIEITLIDRSQDIAHLNALSSAWHRVLEHSMRLRWSETFAIALKSLIQNIQHYQNLGYYLAEYRDTSWLPFPYMDLIQSLHEEYKTHPNSGHLALWIQEINQLLAALNPQSMICRT